MKYYTKNPFQKVGSEIASYLRPDPGDPNLMDLIRKGLIDPPGLKVKPPKFEGNLIDALVKLLNPNQYIGTWMDALPPENAHSNIDSLLKEEVKSKIKPN